MIGMRDDKAREKLLAKEQLDLERCINTLNMLQITHTYAQEINTDVTTHTVKYKSAPNKSTTNNPRSVQSTKHKRHSLSQHGDDRSLCTSCGGSHPAGNCPAHGGPAGIKIYNGLEFAPAGPGNNLAEANEDIHTIIEKFDKYIIGETNETYERYVFNKREQKPEESVELYISALKDLIRSCNFCDCMRDSLMRDRIVLGICDNSTRKMLLQRRNISLKDAVDICRGSEVTKQQMTSISTNATVYVTKPQHIKKHVRKGQDNMMPLLQCKFCGKQHARKKELCPAWQKLFSKCHKQNHFAVCCPPDIRKRVNNLDHQEEHSDSSESDTEYLVTVVKHVSTLEQSTKSHSVEMIIVDTNNR